MAGGGDFPDSYSKLARKAGPRPSPLAAVLVVASPAVQSVPPDQAPGEEPTPRLGMEQDWNGLLSELTQSLCFASAGGLKVLHDESSLRTN